MVNKAALAVAMWDLVQPYCDTEGCDWKDMACIDESQLHDMWARYVSGERSPNVPSAIDAPRSYASMAGAAWATVYRRYLRYMAAMPLSEMIDWHERCLAADQADRESQEEDYGSYEP